MGVTLLELLVSISITALIIGVVVAMSIAASRVWRRSSSFSQAFPPAYLITTRLNQELKNAYEIDVADDGLSITFRLPRTDGDGINVLPFEVGREISYYRADESGDIEHPGTFLWRREWNAVSDVTTLDAIAENVTELTFNLDASEEGRVFAVYSTAITVAGHEQSTEYNSRFESSMAVRNPTGND